MGLESSGGVLMATQMRLYALRDNAVEDYYTWRDNSALQAVESFQQLRAANGKPVAVGSSSLGWLVDNVNRLQRTAEGRLNLNRVPSLWVGELLVKRAAMSPREQMTFDLVEAMTIRFHDAPVISIKFVEDVLDMFEAMRENGMEDSLATPDALRRFLLSQLDFRVFGGQA